MANRRIKTYNDRYENRIRDNPLDPHNPRAWSMPSDVSLLQVLRIQPFELLRNEHAVLPDELVVEPDLTAAVLFCLDHDHVPVDLRFVPVEGLVVGVSRGEVEGAHDLLIEEDVLHCILDVGIHSDGELTHEPGAFVGVEDLVELLVITPRGLHDLPVLKFKGDPLEGCPLVDGRGVEGNGAVHRVLYGCGKDLSIRNVQLSGTLHDWNAFNGEFQICSRADDVDLIGSLHDLLQRVHGFVHGGVVQSADVEVEVLE